MANKLDLSTVDINKIKASVEQATSQAANLASTSNVSGIADSLTKTASTFTKDAATLLKDSKMSSITDVLAKGSSESLSKIQSLAGDSSAALAQPVSFVTKTIKETMGVASTPSDIAGIVDLSNLSMPKDMLNTLSARTGIENLNSGGSITSALKSMSNSISSNISGAMSGLQGFNPTGLFSNLTSSVSGIASKLTSTVSDFSKNALSGALNMLPTSVTSFFNNNTLDLTSQLTDSASFLSSKLPFIGGITDKLLDLNSLLPTGLNYPSRSDTNGNAIPGISPTSNISNTDIDSLYDLARSICNNVGFSGLFNYGNKKDLYDMLLLLAGTLGLSSLLNQLLNCNTYFDNRSNAVLKNKVKGSAVYNGDPYTYNTVATTLSPTDMVDALFDLRYLNANMDLSNDKEGKVAMYNNTANVLGIDKTKLVSGNTYGNRNSLNMQNVVTMSNRNTTIIDSIIPKDTREIGTVLFKAFNQNVI